MTSFWQESRTPPIEPLLASTTHGVLWQSTETDFAMKVPGLADCAATGGETVRISRPANAAKIDLRLIVQGLPLAALCAQRELVALHAAAIATPRGAVVLAGHSGAGKSTLAVALSRRRYAVMADAVTPLDLKDVPASLVQPCMPDVALWRDAAEHLCFDTTKLQPARPGVARYYVPDVPVAADAQPLHALYMLSVHNRSSIEIEVLRGQQRLMEPLHFMFNRMLAETPKVRRRTFERMAATLSQVRVCKLLRPDGVWSLDELTDRVEQDFLQ